MTVPAFLILCIAAAVVAYFVSTSLAVLIILIGLALLVWPHIRSRV